MMEGFGVHTFRFVNEEGQAHFVKFHWKPKLGVHSLVWDEAQKISGKDPDFHRRDLWEAIEMGNPVEFELGVQLIDEKDEFMFDFDILDPTKIWPEEQVPVKIIGKMTLNRNVDNVFAETEQVAFHPGNVVPGIDFTNDPLLQGRLFSYTDTQLIRLGGPNFHEIPINRPVCPFHNNQRDGYSRQTINVGQVAYHKNSLADNTPAVSSDAEGGYVHYQEKVEGRKIQARSESFEDHFSQAKLFWNSMSKTEKKHIVDAFSFELGKVMSKSVRQQVVDMFANVDVGLATAVAEAVGAEFPSGVEESKVTQASPALSQMNTAKLPDTRKVAILIGEGFDGAVVEPLVNACLTAGMTVELVGERFGTVHGTDGLAAEIDQTFLTAHSTLYDAVYVAGGTADNRKKFQLDMADFINEAYRHYKPIGIAKMGVPYFEASSAEVGPGILLPIEMEANPEAFIEAVAAHRHWNRNVYGWEG